MSVIDDQDRDTDIAEPDEGKHLMPLNFGGGGDDDGPIEVKLKAVGLFLGPAVSSSGMRFIRTVKSMAVPVRLVSANLSLASAVMLMGLGVFSLAPASAQEDLSPFTQNVTTHVLLHEFAHAVFREFDIPILANEEVMADSLATSYITQNMREEAAAIILDRARSWLYEDSQVTADDYDHKDEHDLDIRRAYYAACLLYGADPSEWDRVREWARFSEKQANDCSDTAPDQSDGWSTMLAPFLMPSGHFSKNVNLVISDGPMKEAVVASGLLERMTKIARRLDWPEQVTLHFDRCDGTAFWSRQTRTVTLCDAYVARFVAQEKHLTKQQ